MPFDIYLQLPRLSQAAVCKGGVVVPARQFGKARQHIVKEESEPDTFTPALDSDQIHSVIPVAAPHERQAMFAELQPVFDGANAMVIECGRLSGAARQVIVRFLLRLERPTFQKGYLLIEHAGVPDTRDVAT